MKTINNVGHQRNMIKSWSRRSRWYKAERRPDHQLWLFSLVVAGGNGTSLTWRFFQMRAWSSLGCRHGATRVQLQTLIWKSKKYTIDASLHTHILSNWIYWKQLIAYPAHLALFFSLGLLLSRIDDKNHINQFSFASDGGRNNTLRYEELLRLGHIVSTVLCCVVLCHFFCTMGPVQTHSATFIGIGPVRSVKSCETCTLYIVHCADRRTPSLPCGCSADPGWLSVTGGEAYSILVVQLTCPSCSTSN